MNVSTDREDDLDKQCLTCVKNIVAAKGGAAPTLVLDVGGGLGAMAVKMADLGAKVALIDPIEHPTHVWERQDLSHRIRHTPKKIEEANANEILSGHENGKLDVIYAQRVFHYLPYGLALSTLKNLREKYASKNCKLYISLTDIESAMGNTGYAGSQHPVDSPQRHALLLNDEAKHLGITHPMTLYRREEVDHLLKEAGFKNITITRSDYGTFKAVAENELSIERADCHRTPQ